jgi:predicted adenylyl cyclase CyaB
VAANVEIKARVNDLDSMREVVERVADRPGELILKRDVFFHTPRGRLKLRVLGPEAGQLVYYERQDNAGPRRSDYLIAPTPDPSSLERVLGACLGVRGVVSKERWLYWVGNTRIHLDHVEGLGEFLELEVVLEPGQPAEEGAQRARELMERLGIGDADLVDVAYMDLLERHGGC